jgi:transcriptional regulator with XRE-family HTH domain
MSNTDYPTIDVPATGKRIGRLMRARGLGVADLQGCLGLSSGQAVYKWLWGKNLPNVDNLFALSRLLAVPVDGILVSKRAAFPCGTGCPSALFSDKGSRIVYYYLDARTV